MIGVLTPSVFALDLLLPKGYSVWALYLVPLLLTAWLPFRGVPVALASTCTVLVILRFVLPASAVPQWVSASNRAVGIAVVWVVAILLVSRKCTEAALQESEARFRQMADTVQEVFWMAGPSVTETLYVSPAYERLWGRTRESLRASPTAWIEAIHPDDRARSARSSATARRRATWSIGSSGRTAPCDGCGTMAIPSSTSAASSSASSGSPRTLRNGRKWSRR
jgi:PAS domain-containing protein